ncbi:protein nirf [Anaeramoeba ignava]|uniref:Protein nirf n=1 Tax=Anaeramoeba ignava TaxID=1746090 RepID=A0A9Q0RA94_ANAIG|nr:protein nirf [Anaeramoeba ignava]
MKNKLILFVCFTSFLLLVKSNDQIDKVFTFPISLSSPLNVLVDSDEGFVYVVDEMNSASTPHSFLFKFDMNTLEFLDALDLGIIGAYGAVIDTVNKFVYVATYNSPPVQISKVDLKKFEVVDILTLDVDVKFGAWIGQIDIVNQKAYFGCNSPPFVVKIDLTTFTEETNLSLSHDWFDFLIIDIPNGFLYAITEPFSGDNQTLYKISLSSLIAVDTLFFNSSNDSGMDYGAIDYSTQKMYVGTGQSPMGIVIVDLVNFTKQENLNFSALSINKGVGIDETNGNAILVDSNGVMAKMDLTNNSIIDTLNTISDGSYVDSVVFDIETEKVYIATDYRELIEVDLSLFQVEKTTTPQNYSNPDLLLIDESNQNGYFEFLISNNYSIIKFDLQSLSIIDNLDISQECEYGEIDTLNGFLYLFPTSLNGLNIGKLRLSNFSFEEFNQIHDNGTIESITFDEQKGILYFGYLNNDNSNYEMIQVNVTDLTIIGNSSFGNETDFLDINIDTSNEYLYSLYSNTSDYNNYLSKINSSNLNIIDNLNFEDSFSEYFFEKSCQYFYFQNSTNNLISRVDLTNMIIMNDSLNVTSFYLYPNNFEFNNGSIYLIGSNSSSSDQLVNVLEVELSSNQLISNISTEYSWQSLISEYDSSKSIVYLLNSGQQPYSLYEIQQPTPTPTPKPSSSQQILFSILILGITIIFGLF